MGDNNIQINLSPLGFLGYAGFVKSSLDFDVFIATIKILLNHANENNLA